MASIYWVFDVTNFKNNSEIEHENGIVTVNGVEYKAILRELNQ